MQKLKMLAGVSSVVAMMVMGLAAAADDPAPTIKQIMGKLHKGANAPVNTVKAQLKTGSPDWKKVQDSSKDIVILAAGLSKQDPPKGEKDSWTKLADAHFEDAKALDTAAKAENLDGTKAAAKKIGESCKSCHAAHKGK